MMNVLFDAVVLAILVFFAWRGAKRGLVLTVCGLVAVLVALIGASVLSNLLAEPLASVAEPMIEKSIQGKFETASDDLPLDALVDALEDSPWLSGFAQSFQSAVHDGTAQLASSAVRSIAHYAAVQIAHSILFALGFVLILIVWFILSHALDLVTKLPVLHTLNGLGGGVAGLLKGFLVLCIVGLVLRFSSWPSEDMLNRTYLLRYFLTDNFIIRMTGV